jgi:hypothetical protein
VVDEAQTGLTGGCQCGAVRYRLEAKPKAMSICHCRMCQKASGGPFMAFAGVRLSRLVWTRGAPSIFASSDIAERGFCGECGTPLTYRGLGSDRISVTLGSLDDPDVVEPAVQLGVESRLRWLNRTLNAPEIRTEQWLTREKIQAVHNRQHPDHET